MSRRTVAVMVAAAWTAVAPRSAAADEPAAAEPTEVAEATDEELIAAALAAGEVIEVEGTAPEVAEPAEQHLDVEQLRTLPGAGNDPLRALQILPGFARPPFGMGGLIVRGVSPRNAGVFVDGMRVPLAFHFIGITSFFPSSLIDSVDVYSSGATVGYGRTMGAVVDIHRRRGRRDRWRVGGELGLLDAGAVAEGPVAGGALIVGVRRSYVDALLLAAGFDGNRPAYLDAQLEYDRGDVDHRGGALSAMLLVSDDKVAGEVEASLGFVRGMVTWERRIGTTTVHVAPWLGRDRAGVHVPPGDNAMDGDVVSNERRSTPMGLRAVLSGYKERLEWWLGVDVEGGHLGPTTTVRIENDPQFMLFDEHVLPARWAFDAGVFFETVVHATDRVALRPGIRLDTFDHQAEWAVDPRLTISEKLTDQVTIRQSIAIQHQPPAAADLDWGDGESDLRSSWAQHASVGVELQLTPSTRLHTEIYSIEGHGLPVLRAGFDAPEEAERWGEDMEDLGPMLDELLSAQIGTFGERVSTGEMHNRGVEIDARHQGQRGDLWLAYTWSRARRDPYEPALQLRDKHGSTPYLLDQTHTLSAALSAPVGAWRFGARLSAATGVPIEQPTATGLAQEFVRLSPTMSLDLRVDRSWKTRAGTIRAYLDVHNATNRRNAESAKKRGLPILPFLGVAFEPR